MTYFCDQKQNPVNCYVLLNFDWYYLNNRTIELFPIDSIVKYDKMAQECSLEVMSSLILLVSIKYFSPLIEKAI